MLIIRRSKLHYTASGIITPIGVYLYIFYIFISVFNQPDAQNLFYSKFYFMSLHVSSTCAHHQEVKIALHSLWYHQNYWCLFMYFYVFISVFNQLDAQNLFYSKFYFVSVHVSSTCARNM